MEIVFLTASKYILMLFFALYTLNSFLALKNHRESENKGTLFAEKFFLYSIHLVGNAVIYLNTKSDKVLLFYGCQLILFIAIMELFPILYPHTKRNLLNHICMLLNISFLIMTRLSMERSVKQFKILLIAVVLFFVIPWIYKKIKRPERGLWFYFAIGFLALCVVLVMSQITYGAKLSLTIGPITLQPSEFVKITFVFMLAACFTQGKSLKHVLFAGVLAGMHVIVLVLSTDLGASLIFCVTYLMVVFAATSKKRYLLVGGIGGAFAAVIAWKMFYHIQVRVSAWLDPFADIANKGYQMAQSLFAIGTGKWTGTGLYEGLPTSIPIVYQDFTFSAIAEEFGGLFAICLIFLYFNIFVLIMQIALEQKNLFCKYACTGLAVVLEMQTFLTIGGAIKLIPSTGVTLPCISYGGSSIMSMMMIFALVQAMYGKEAQQVYEERRRIEKEEQKRRLERAEKRKQFQIPEVRDAKTRSIKKES